MSCTARSLALAGLVCSSLVFAQESPVSPKEIQDGWVGNDVIGSTGAGAKVWLRLEADGTASVAAGATNDTGKWRLSETGYCATWNTIRAGQERCFTVTRAGGTFKVLNPDGSLSAYITSIK